jgi:DegV family protein with EDD domain
MAKVAIVTDSNSGITQKEGKELGIWVIPMPFMINEEEFFEDITLTQEEFYERLASGADVITSQPSPYNVTSTWDEALETHDEVVHIPMSSALSMSCESAIHMAKDYEGKVEVVDNVRISVTQRQSVFDAMALAEAGKSAAEIKQILLDDKMNCSIYIMLNTLYYLKKGGRLTPAAAMLGTILKIKPVLQVKGTKLDAFAKARTIAQGKTIMTNAIKHDMETRFGGADREHVKLHLIHTHNALEVEQYHKDLETIFPDLQPIEIGRLSLSVSCHIGPGSLALAVTQNLKI